MEKSQELAKEGILDYIIKTQIETPEELLLREYQKKEKADIEILKDLK